MLVIQVSTDDLRTQNIAMNNAINLLKSPASKPVPNLAMHDITFSACGNTRVKIEEKSSKEVVLVEGVQIVQVGVLRIRELQEQRYAYNRPWRVANWSVDPLFCG